MRKIIILILCAYLTLLSDAQGQFASDDLDMVMKEIIDNDRPNYENKNAADVMDPIKEINEPADCLDGYELHRATYGSLVGDWFVLLQDQKLNNNIFEERIDDYFVLVLERIYSSSGFVDTIQYNINVSAFYEGLNKYYVFGSNGSQDITNVISYSFITDLETCNIVCGQKDHIGQTVQLGSNNKFIHNSNSTGICPPLQINNLSDACFPTTHFQAESDGTDITITTQGMTDVQFEDLITQYNITQINLNFTDYTNNQLFTYTLYDNYSGYNFENFVGVIPGWGSPDDIGLNIELITATETHECPIGVVPVTNFDPVCEVLELLLHHSSDGQSVTLDYIDPANGLYLQNMLGYRGMTIADATQVLDNYVDLIEGDLIYTNTSGSGQSTVTYTRQLGESINNVVLTFPDTDTIGLEGYVDLSYSKGDNLPRVCRVSPIKFLEAPGPLDSLPTSECGDTHVVPNGSNPNSLELLEEGMLITSNGIYFIVTLVTSSQAPFAGEALAAVPFGSKRLAVEFSGLSINEDKVVTSGVLSGIEASPGTFPEFNIDPDTISFGGEICIPDPEPEEEPGSPPSWPDSRGFNQDSTHINGTNWDDYGFDVNGVHKDTGTPFDPDGCNQEGEDEFGNKCRQNNDYIQKINDLVDSIGTSLPGAVEAAIRGVDSLLNNLNCQSKRDSMLSLLNGPLSHLDRKYIIGDKSEYLLEGMSQEFTSTPKIPVTRDDQKNPDITLLEALHVDLYQCDQSLLEMREIKANLEQYTAEELEALIIKTLKTYAPYQLEQIKNDPALLLKEVKDILQKIVDGEITDASKLHSRFDYWSQSYSYYNSTASNSSFIPADAERLEEINWMYLNNFQEIGGQHKGFYVEGLFKALKSQKTFSGHSSNNILPFELTKNLTGVAYNIYLSNIRFHHNKSVMDVYFVFEDPNNGKRMVFSALDVEFNNGGIVGPSTLKLNSNIELKLTNTAMLILDANTTEVNFDCSGFLGMRVAGGLELCRNFIIPVDRQTMQPTTDPNDRYRLSFDVEIERWEDFYIELNSSGVNNRPFVIPSKQDMIWEVADFVIDGSDIRSYEGQLQYGYESVHSTVTPSSNNGNSSTTKLLNTWKGVYIGTISVNFPSSIGGQQGDTEILAQDLLIDGAGVSIYASVNTTILSIDDGNAGGWPIGIDGASILVLKNRIAGGGFEGQIKVPMLSNPLDYKAEFSPEGMSLTVSPFTKATKMDMLLADVTLDSTSTIEMAYIDEEFTIVATINGEMQIGGGPGDLALNPIRFNELKLANRAPYIQGGTWTMDDGLGLKMGGFGITLGDIKDAALDSSDAEIYGLSFGLGVTLASGDTDISAKGTFDVLGKMEVVNERQTWDFYKFKVNSLTIDVKANFGSLYGHIERFENHEKYGKGFAGMIDAQFNGMPKFVVKGMFGNQTNYKYFFLDAVVSGIDGINIGPLEVNGFIGGFSYHMRRTDGDGVPSNPCTTNSPRNAGPAESLTGSIYEPDPAISLGFKFGACIQMTGSSSTFNGFVTYSMQFLSGGGVSEIALEGVGQFMADIDKMKGMSEGVKQDSTKAPEMNSMVSAHIRVKFDFENNDLHGKLVTYVDIKKQIVGTMNSEGKAIDAEFRINKNEWFIYIGTPDNPCQLSLNIPLLNVTMSAYLDIGSSVPSIPDLDPRINDILNLAPVNQGFRDSGAGFVFGAKIEANMNVDVAKIASAELTALMGFDVMVKDFGDASCRGEDGTIGINGWYAVGQIYAYLEGSIKVMGINIISAGIAAALQAQMPNPFFAQAAVGVRYKLFGRQKKATAKMKIGRRCVIDTDNPLGMDVILDVNPADNVLSVPTDSKIQVAFNVPVATDGISITDVNGNEKTYNIEITDVLLKNKDLNYELQYEYEWDEEHMNLNVVPLNILYSNDTFEFSIELKVDDGSQVINESRDIQFVTGRSLPYISESNVAHAYPFNGMTNYYKDEFNEYYGYIILNSGIPQLAYDDEYDMYARFNDGVNEELVKVEYDPLNRELRYPMPTGFLQNGKVYELAIVHKKKVSGNELAFNSGSSGASNNDLTNPDIKPHPLYKIKFRVSKYDTFSDKIKNTLVHPSNPTNSYRLDIIDEPFSVFEFGNEGFQMTKANISFKSNEWDWLMDGFEAIESWPFEATSFDPVSGFESTTLVRNNFHTIKYFKYGKSLVNKGQPNSLHVSDMNVGDVKTDFSCSNCYLESNAFITAKRGLEKIKQDVLGPIGNNANGSGPMSINTSPSVISDLLNFDFHTNMNFDLGTFRWRVEYVLPGKGTPTSINKIK